MSEDILWGVLGEWRMVRNVRKEGKVTWILAECKRFEQDRNGGWYAMYKDIDGYVHSYDLGSLEEIMEFVEPIPNRSVREYFELFRLSIDYC